MPFRNTLEHCSGTTSRHIDKTPMTGRKGSRRNCNYIYSFMYWLGPTKLCLPGWRESDFLQSPLSVSSDEEITQPSHSLAVYTNH